MSIDIGFTHIALSAKDIDESIAFYSKYANMSVIHERIDAETSVRVIWLSDKTRPFVIVLLQNKNPETILNPLSHLGVGCASKQEIDRLCDLARFEGILVREPQDSGYPIGYWALLQDPTGQKWPPIVRQVVNYVSKVKLPSFGQLMCNTPDQAFAYSGTDVCALG